MWKYIKNIWEGEDGKLSIRRVSSLVFLTLVVHMIVKGQLTTNFQLYALYSLETTFLLLISVITVDNIIKFWRGSIKEKDGE